MYVDDVLHRWVVEIVRATRQQEDVVIGASVRGSLALERAARAWALFDGRGYVVPEDIERLLVPGARPSRRLHARFRSQGEGDGLGSGDR